MLREISNTLGTLMAIQDEMEMSHRHARNYRQKMGTVSYPAVNIFQQEDNTVVVAELPGMKREDIKVEVKDEMLRIFGERKMSYDENSKAHRIERRGIKFDRKIKLPIRVESDGVQAEYENGMLQITLPQAESEKPKQVLVA